MTLPADAIERLARTGRLLVACDYDGVLAPIVNDPAQARPMAGAVEALTSLAALPAVDVAVVSGRSRASLAKLLACPPSIHLIGSHGAENPFDPGAAPPASAVAVLDDVERELASIAAAPGLLIERKPFSVAFHYRAAATADAEAALERVMSGPASRPSIRVRPGSMVVELTVASADKGGALRTLMHRLGPSITLFFGDDLTDEDALAVLQPGDIGVAVSRPARRSTHFVESPGAVVQALTSLAQARSAHFGAAATAPIERHWLLSDQRTLALVSPTADIAWLCLPRADSPAAFHGLLGGSSRYTIRPAHGHGTITQKYLADSFVLETSFERVTVIDYLDCSGGRAFQRAGRADLIRAVDGSGTVRIEFAPRLDFGRSVTTLHQVEGGIEVGGSPDPLVLASPGVEWQIVSDGQHHAAIAEYDLARGPLVLELRAGTGSARPAVLAESGRRAANVKFWAGWAATLNLPARAQSLVKRSALAIRALCHGPSGAMLAAGTTSLPEWMGGLRNWDYRFCWPRDAALAAASLVRLGNTGQAMRLLDWILAILDGGQPPERLRPIYTVTGGELGGEGEISELPGYAGSRPVRIGNAAAMQVQLDVFGPIVDLAARLLLAGAPLSPEHWRLVEAMVTAVERRWSEPDHGIWEIRHKRQHHVHSKAMCWLAADRAAFLADHLVGKPRPQWERLRDEIGADILSHGYNQDVGAFTAAYESPEIDAASLWVGLSGLLPPGDPRIISTTEAVERVLRDGPTVYRYRCDDGLPGSEGGWHVCAAWLVESYLLAGRRADASELFDRMCELVGPTGLLSEQYDPHRREHLGNFPQAYSHLAIINAACALSAAT